MAISLRRVWEARTLPTRLPALAGGIRAANTGGIVPFPFRSLRRLLRSLEFPAGIALEGKRLDVDDVPRRGGLLVKGDYEAQGICYVGPNLAIVNTRNSLLTFQITPSGLTFTNGKRHLSDVNASDRPCHLSAPTLYSGHLLVPAEGVPSQGLQWIWIFDPTTLSYRGRMGIPDLFDDGERDEISWCAADEETGLLYCSRYRSHPESDVRYNPVNVHVYRLPDLSSLPSSFDQMAEDVIWLGKSPPIAILEKVGVLAVREWPHTGISKVQGGAITNNGHLAINFSEVVKGSKTEDCYGIMLFDLLTGLSVRYASLDPIVGIGDQLQGMTIRDGKVDIVVYVWEPEDSKSGLRVWTVADDGSGTL